MAEPVTYSGYLRLDQLLSAQQPKSSEHDEMLFIVIHQIYELWFKQLLHEFGKAQAELEAGSTTHAMRTLRRTLAILKIVVAQLDVLETMTPTQFTRFRDWLGTSSGFESAQFRELEAVLGRRDRMMVARYAEGSAERERITAAMARPSLFDSFVRYLAGQGYQVPAEIAGRDVGQLDPVPAVPLGHSFGRFLFLFPLDGGRRFAGDVEDDPVDLDDLVGDPGGNPGQHVVRQPGPVGRHRVLAGHRAEHDRVA